MGAQKSSICPFCWAISDQIMWWPSSCLACEGKLQISLFSIAFPVVWLLQPCVSKALLWCLVSLYYWQEGRDQHENSTEQGVSCRATGAVSMTWDSSKPENQIKVKMLGNTNVQSVFWQPHPTPASSSAANTINTEQETHPTQTSGVGNSNPLPGMGFNRREKFK